MYCRALYNHDLNPKFDTKVQYELLFTFHSKQDTAWCLVKFLFGHFKEEDIFNFQDFQCIQALHLGLKMPMVPYQYNENQIFQTCWNPRFRFAFVQI